MAALVRGLDVHADQVHLVQSRNGRLALAPVVGVQVAVGSLDLDGPPADGFGDTTDQVHGGDGGAKEAVQFFERFEFRSQALAPEPDLCGRLFAEVPADAIDFVVGQDFAAGFHQAVDLFGAAALRQMPRGRPAQDVVRRRGPKLAPAVPAMDQQVAVAHAGVKLPVLVAQGFGDIAEERPAFLGRDSPGRIIDHRALDHGYQVAAEDQVVPGQGDVPGQGLQRRAAGVDGGRVVAQQAEDGHVAAGRQVLGDIARRAEAALGGHAVEGRAVGQLEGGAAPQRVLRQVAGPVGDDDGVFHRALSWSTTRIRTGWLRTVSSAEISARAPRTSPSRAW